MALTLEQAAWRAVDAMAEDIGLTVTELARRAGLNHSSLHPCKRAAYGDQERGLSFRTVHALCRVTGWGLSEFAAAVEDFMSDDFSPAQENHHAAHQPG